MRIRLATYSTKARGGVVHALSLAEALSDRGLDVELWALSPDGARFFREPRVSTHLVPVPRVADEPIDDRILRYADALARGMSDAGACDINHAEDCLSARSMLALRAAGRLAHVVRTIHHVDQFTSPVLDACQTASIVDVDHRLCVSDYWADRVRDEFGVTSQVVANGVDVPRYADCQLSHGAAALQLGWPDRPAVLAVGGIEPRKGSRTLLAAIAELRHCVPGVLLVVAGGETLFDYADYRDGWWSDAAALGVRVHEGQGPVPRDADVAVLGPVADNLMPVLYRACDVLAFPSTLEGFGLVVLEALAAGTPAVVSDLPVLREHLRDGRDCLMVGVDDAASLAAQLERALSDTSLREVLIAHGRATADRFTWAACAERHEHFYREVLHAH